MEQNKPSDVVGFFTTKAQAESATDELWRAGLRHNQIGMAVPGGDVHQATTRSEAIEETAASGTARGAVTGGVVGLIGGAALAVLVPAGGLLLLVGAAAGAAVGAYAGPFLAMGRSKEKARPLGEDKVKGGRTVLVVRPDKVTQSEKAVEVIHSHGGHIETSLTAMLAGHQG
jgi:uncharacterized membrane protein